MQTITTWVDGLGAGMFRAREWRENLNAANRCSKYGRFLSSNIAYIACKFDASGLSHALQERFQSLFGGYVFLSTHGRQSLIMDRNNPPHQLELLLIELLPPGPPPAVRLNPNPFPRRGKHLVARVHTLRLSAS
jgi:hypothetical protein